MLKANLNVLFVDDDEQILSALKRVFRKTELNVSFASSAADAEELLRTMLYAAVVCDIHMPFVSGVNLLAKISNKYPNVIRGVLSGSTNHEDYVDAVNYGDVSTVITKPWSDKSIVKTVEQMVEMFNVRSQNRYLNEQLNQKNDQLKEMNDNLLDLVEERTKEISMTQEATILCLAALTEARDQETGNHIRRTQHYVKTLAALLKQEQVYSEETSVWNDDLLYKSAALHDIGKVGIPDGILKKKGTLTADEYEVMKQHTVYGRAAIVRARDMLGGNSFLQYAYDITYTHHEHWDGTGYPSGLSGVDIPLAGRCMAIADVYDALISPRCYKAAYDHHTACNIIYDDSGRLFDPVIVNIFKKYNHKFREIAEQFPDESDNFSQQE